MKLAPIVIYFIFVGFLYSCSSYPHGHNKLLGASPKLITSQFGKPSSIREHIMKDGTTFKTLHYPQFNVSYVIDVKQEIVCEISTGLVEIPKCYPSDYE